MESKPVAANRSRQKSDITNSAFWAVFTAAFVDAVQRATGVPPHDTVLAVKGDEVRR